MVDIFVIGGLRVLVDQSTGHVLSVQDAETGCAADLLWSRAAIAQAISAAHMAWASTADACV
jgi:hypothetical protein